MSFLKSLTKPPVGPAIAGAIAVVEVGAMAVHFYAHKPIEPKSDQAGFYGVHAAILPHGPHHDGGPPLRTSDLLVQVSTASASTSVGPISWLTPGWPPSST